MSTAAAVAMSPPDSIIPSGKMRSVEASRAVANVEGITKTERLVLHALAEFAGIGEHGLECHPGIKTIAARAHISERHATRAVHALRAKHIITFDDNKGGKRNSNRYLLLFANPDKSNHDIFNNDICNPDIDAANPDKMHTLTLTKHHANPDILNANPDTAMSGEGFEWYEGFNEWKQQWEKVPSNGAHSLFKSEIPDHSSHPSRFFHYGDVIDQVQQFENRPEDLLHQILKGTPIEGEWKCKRRGHGPFMRPGYRFGNWIAWCGHESCYSSTWTDDAGCQACKSEHEEGWKDEPETKRERFRQTLPVRRFDLKTPATCPDHGHFMFWAQLYEYGEEWARVMGQRLRLEMEHAVGCPGCDADWIYEQQVQEDLGLTNEEWDRGGKRIIAAIDYAKEKPSDPHRHAFVMSAVQQ